MAKISENNSYFAADTIENTCINSRSAISVMLPSWFGT